MAGVDYRHCDNCGCKTFYDADLCYEFPRNDEDRKDEARVLENDVRTELLLGNLGAWAVLCRECTKTHKAVIVPIEEVKP